MALPIDPAWLALIGTLFGGAGLKFAEHWLNRNKTNVDDARQIREELRTQVTAQKEEIDRLEAEVVTWRDKFYNLRDDYMKQHTELTLALAQIKSGAQTMERQVQAIDKHPPT